jgi:SAM-dependent methyltransferase
MLRWFEVPMGRRVLDAQRAYCRGLSAPPGFRLIQLGVSPCHGVADCFSQPSRFIFTPEPGLGADGVSRFDALPLPSDTFDVVILHHALDFCHHPQRVLAEAARIVRPGGRIVLIGFNPCSALGIGKWLLAPFSAAGVWRHNSLRRSRVCDWLALLRFGLDSEPKIAGPRRTSWPGLRKLMKRGLERFLVGGEGSFYVLTARKRTIPLQPLVSLPWLQRRITRVGGALNFRIGAEPSGERARCEEHRS